MAQNDQKDELEPLLARCASGEAAALKLLYQKTAAQLFGVLRRILLRDDLAQDALQDVYVSVWRNAKDYRAARGSPFTWMVSIARYRAIDIKRSRSRLVHFADPSEYVQENDDASGSDLAALAARDADARRLKDCLDELSAMQRNAVCLAYLHGLTHEEVAGTLAAPLGTVKSWVRRGLESLRGCIER
ncbi:MAG TPA: sigma-70 family RNA polymerase sigma factor [Gammaproteobacteria bacterium]|nr:sigma-70 family RNA polymerase sigma factor [Gammaproteobacteria bacterium]